MRTALGILCLLLLCGLLVAGLWPFGSPANRVAWLGDGTGLRFGGRGTAIGIAPLGSGPSETAAGAGSNIGWSLELWLRPAGVGSSTILAVDSPASAVQLSVRQSLTDVALRVERGGRHIDYYVDDILHPGKPVFLTVTAGAGGLRAYVNGAPGRRFGGVHVPAASVAGKLVLANSVRQHDSWRGDFLGLAVYSQELSGDEAAGHYENWMKLGKPGLTEEGAVPQALFRFDDRGGRYAHNSGASKKPGLLIPRRYTILRQWLLQPFWREFEPAKAPYWADVVINIGGFVPFGFFMRAYLSWWSASRRSSLAGAVLAGAAVSLAIEILQSRLPTRDSSMTDVITNTLGSCLGALGCGSHAARMFLGVQPAAVGSRDA